jgi:hypothetical protein
MLKITTDELADKLSAGLGQRMEGSQDGEGENGASAGGNGEGKSGWDRSWFGMYIFEMPCLCQSPFSRQLFYFQILSGKIITKQILQREIACEIPIRGPEIANPSFPMRDVHT